MTFWLFKRLSFQFQDRYPNVKRGNFATLDENHLKFFKDALGANRVITDEAECQSYNVDWIKNVRGK